MESKQMPGFAEDELSALEAELMLLESMRSSVQPDSSPDTLQPARTDGPISLSFAQQRLWFLEQLAPGSPAYTLFNAVRLSGQLETSHLAQAFTEVIRRHASLRTHFALQHNSPVQIVAPPATFALPVIDLTRLAPSIQDAQVQWLASAEAQRTFDLVHGPLLRATLLRLQDTEHLQLVTMHHIITDGWSIAILLRELATLYHGALNNQPARLPDLPIQYPDFAVWQRAWLQGERLAEQVFEPLMAAHGPLAGSLGSIIGVGPGRGIGLLFVVWGALILLVIAGGPRIPGYGGWSWNCPTSSRAKRSGM